MKLRKKFGLFLICVICLMIIFAFTDLSISKSLYNKKSKFGEFFQITAPIPNMIVGPLSAAVLFRLRNKKSHLKNYLVTVIYAGFFLIASIIGAYVPLHYMGYGLFSSIHIIVTAIYSVAIFIFAHLIKIDDVEKFRKIAYIGFIVFVMTPVIVEIVKTVWGRVRFREMSEPYDMFTGWFFPQFFKHTDTFIDPSSFPSGHTANAAVIFMIMFLPELYPTFENKKAILFSISGIWTICTAIGRIIAGAHFASDVTMGAFLAVVIIGLSHRLVYSKFGEKITSLLE